MPRLDEDVAASRDPDGVPQDEVLAREKGATHRQLPMTAVPFPPSSRRIDLPAMLKGGLATAGKARSRIAEEFRVTVVRALHYLREGRAPEALPNVILVTSAIPGEGKTFTAFNLAASIAGNWLGDVLLVDTDTKLGSLSSLLDVGTAAGLLNYAADDNLSLGDLVFQTGVAGLHFLPIGASNATAEDGSVVRPIGTAIERISRELPGHIIVLDCAPCLSSSDAVAFAPLAAEVIMVIEAGRTQRSEIDISLELIRSCRNISLVLNKVRFTTTATFGAYYHGSES
ncbi:P-loop NTPase family protein [Rhodovastum atsumiense]|uniref:CpsD/CapB family tyrosine-protein kinase n=1 Tax=Rhodovastum atsumiense TaxID=504468 RepID=A0A5M6IK81_9PROT|nr:hypothetical protein [Rhodovastum atsumiense]KAA5608661.1 hypothetical protein F1189_28040 [Rhodovastum atsumiense]